VSFLIYSRVPERRSVAITIADSGLVTLREGQSAHDFEVVRIFSNGVELEWNGTRFSVPARD